MHDPRIPAPRSTRLRSLGPRIAVALLMGATLALAILRWSDLEGWLQSAGTGGALVFVGVFILLTVCCFPVSVFGFTAGFIYGPILGFLLLLVSVPMAASVMFSLGRSALRGFVLRQVGRDRRLMILERMASRQALRLNVLARLSPFNYGIVCYTLAAGRTGWRDYLLGLMGTLPSMVLQVAAGVLARQGLSGGETDGWRIGATALGVAALLALGWQVSRLARRAWQEAAVAHAANDTEVTSGDEPAD